MGQNNKVKGFFLFSAMTPCSMGDQQPSILTWTHIAVHFLGAKSYLIFS